MVVTFKTPDVIDAALEDVPEEERDAIEKFLKQYIYWGEYVRIEFNVENQTATVLRSK